MRILGLRCSNSDFTYVILEGKKDSPKLVKKATVAFPKNYNRPRVLEWFFLEMQRLIRTYEPKGIGIKLTEVMARRGTPHIERVGNEAIIMLAATQNNIRDVECRVKSTIAKNLGYKGKGRYLENALDNSPLEEFNKESEKIKEAIFVAWSMLR